jgi:hypothetical protein
VLGRTEPRLWTPPLRELTPETSYGFAVIDFARDVLQEPLDAWQEWVAIHAGELLEDGRPRFRTVLILVARQQGKTHLLKVLSLFWLYVEQFPLILGMSTNLDTAREAWEKAVDAAESVEALASLTPSNGVRRANGEQCLTTSDRCRYKIAASNRRGGRGLTVDRLVLDELREHRDWSAWNAATNALNARPYGQAFAITNQGDDESVVLNSLRDNALQFIQTGEGDERLGLFEYSAPEGADLLDLEALAQANPNVGRRVDWDTLLGPARRAKVAGGEEEAGYRTEVMCQRVRHLDPAVDLDRWAECSSPDSMDNVKNRTVLVFDVAPDGQHATLAVAARTDDEKVRVELVESWSGIGCVSQLIADLPGWLERIKPRAIGWFPAGPAAAVAADMAESRSRHWPPAGVQIEELRDTAAVCMGFSEDVKGDRILHSNQALLNDHVAAVQKLKTGDRWVFSRRGHGHADAAYAAAGAAHLAKLMPVRALPPQIIRASTRPDGPDGRRALPYRAGLR